MTPDREQGEQARSTTGELVGVHPLLGLPERRRRPVGSADHRGQHERGRAGRHGWKPYYFPDDLTDKSVEWLHAVRAQDPEKPWFLYYSTGCAHAPHHVAKEWADKYKGKFDQGWDKLREEVFARQKKLGVIPQDAVLTERPDLFDAWDSLDDASKKLYMRQMEVYAGFMDNADWNVGRLLDAVEEMGDLDNTLVLYIWGDNGASSRARRPARSTR